MKKTLLLLVVVATVFACGSSQQAPIVSKKTMKGYWTLSSITYSESGEYDVTLLNDASKDCFEGSSWRFIPNNNTGYYNLDGAGCDTSQKDFVFTVEAIDKNTGLYDFLLKPTNAKHKSDTNAGFRMKLASLQDTFMQWQQTVSVEGDPFTIYMNFTKISE